MHVCINRCLILAVILWSLRACHKLVRVNDIDMVVLFLIILADGLANLSEFAAESHGLYGKYPISDTSPLLAYALPSHSIRTVQGEINPPLQATESNNISALYYVSPGKLTDRSPIRKLLWYPARDNCPIARVGTAMVAESLPVASLLSSIFYLHVREWGTGMDKRVRNGEVGSPSNSLPLPLPPLN